MGFIMVLNLIFISSVIISVISMAILFIRIFCLNTNYESKLDKTLFSIILFSVLLMLIIQSFKGDNTVNLKDINNMQNILINARY